MRSLSLVIGTLAALGLWRVAQSRFPRFARSLGSSLEAVTSEPRRCVIVMLVLPIVLRLSLLPWVPPPRPAVHDEFSHLLVADTLSSLRLANPSHPLGRHFETIYVLQAPTYASIYPIGQGLSLALGKALFGTYWAAVLLATGLMCGAIAWMLFACLPPKWAALGSLAAATQFGVGAWVNTYYGGAFCAFGGALLFGALYRLSAKPSPALALIAGAGWSIAWFTRPYESLALFLIVWAWIGASAWRARAPRRPWLAVALVLALTQSAAIAGMLLHNRAVTGSLLETPYGLSQRTYGMPQTFLGQRPIAEPAHATAEVKAMYGWQLGLKSAAEQHPLRHLFQMIDKLFAFFVTPWYLLPLAVSLIAGLRRDPDVRLATAGLAVAIAASWLYPHFAVHYVAAFTCVVMLVLVKGLMLLKNWSPARLPLGRQIVAFLIVGGILGGGLNLVPAKAVLGLESWPATGIIGREHVTRELEAAGGTHVVFVRYLAGHNIAEEWVYNAAEIDSSPIVWSRAVSLADDGEVIDYYPDRKIWLAEVAFDSWHLAPYAR